MKIIHTGDTHIGYSAYTKPDENGYNQREMDVYNAFTQVIDKAIEIKPDAVLHAGDLFDSVRPTNRAISFVIGELQRLSAEEIPFVVISGNHSTPRLRETGSVLRILEHIPHVACVYKGSYERIDINGMAIHAVPHISDQDKFREELAKISLDKDAEYNVGMIHAGAVGISVFRHGEFNEAMVKTGQLDKGMDYFALGHYHEHVQVAPNATYCGSTERLGFGEAGQKKGFIVLDLEKKKEKFIELNIREMVDIKPVDCLRSSAMEINATVSGLLDSIEPEGKIVRLTLKHISPSEIGGLDGSRFKKQMKDAVHFSMRYVRAEEGGASAAENLSDSFNRLEDEFTSFVKRTSIEGISKEKIKTLGVEYLQRAGQNGGDE